MTDDSDIKKAVAEDMEYTCPKCWVKDQAQHVKDHFSGKRHAIECLSCGLRHPSVEAAGVWYCPNPLCAGAGAEWFRRTLPSFKDHGHYHTVDEREWLEKGLRYAARMDDVDILAAAEKRSEMMMKKLERECD